MSQYDISILGGGTAGLSAAWRASELGASVCLIEKEELLGGRRIHVNPFPGRMLLRRMDERAGMPEQEGPPALDKWFAEAKAKSLELAEVWKERVHKRKIVLVHGSGRVLGPREIAVTTPDGDEIIKSGKIVLATGSVKRPESLLPVDGKTVLEDGQVLHMNDMPGNVMVLGAGRSGCEWSVLLKRLGGRVFLVDERERLLEGQDDDLMERFENEFRRNKIKLLLNSKLQSVYRNGAQVDVTLEGGIKFSVDRVVVNQGRTAQSSAVSEAGVELGEAEEVLIDETLETSLKGVYGAGSVCGPTESSDISEEEGRIAVENALGKKNRFARKQAPFIVQCGLEYARVGCLAGEAHFDGFHGVEGRCELGRLDGAAIWGPEKGIIKIVGDRSSQKIIGGHALAPGAGDMIALVRWAIDKGLKVKEITDMRQEWTSPFMGLQKAARSCLAKLMTRA